MAEKSQDSKQKSDPDYVCLKVLTKYNTYFLYNIKRDAPLKELISTYSSQFRSENQTVKFLFKYTAIKETDTARALNLKDGDIIEPFILLDL